MQITFSNNPIDRFNCWLSNTYEKLTQFRWQLKHHRVVCHICGEVLDSKEEKYSPEQCGWKRLKDEWYRPWICHTCLYHRDFEPHIKKIDKEQRRGEDRERMGQNV